MIHQILKTITRYQMFQPGERVVVAVSGGPDSMALLSALDQMKFDLCLQVCVAHLDHNLRKESARDLVFVKKFSESRGFPFLGRALDWRGIKKTASLEDCLRKLRYDFLFDAGEKFRAKKIVVGHTKDDQAETVLMRILRGSGLYGLSAILPKRRLGSFEIVRPLIEVSRHDVMSYLKKNKIPYRIDKTNLEDKFLRNKVRHRLLPLLEKEYNSNIKETLSSLSLIVGADYDYLCREVTGFLKKNLRVSKGGAWIKLGALKKLDLPLRRLAVRMAIEAFRGDLRRLTFQHCQDVEALIFSKPYQAEVHLPGGVTVSKTKGCLNIFKR